MEELVKQFEGFFQSFWGGLISLAGVLASAFAVYHHATKEWNLGLAIGYLALGMSVTLFLFTSGHIALGVLAILAEILALVVLVVGARAGKQEEKAPPTSLSKSWWAQVIILGVVMAVLVWGILWAAGYTIVAFFFLGVGFISYVLFLLIILWRQRGPRAGT